MANVRIVTDSAAELPPQLVEELGITVIPWRIHLGTETIPDSPELRDPQFYREVIKKRVALVALPPSVHQFAQVYERLARETDSIVSVHTSSALAKVVDIARQGRIGLLGRCQVNVVDSQFIARALGLLVVEAAKAAREGATAHEIVRLVHAVATKTYFALYVDSFEHLRRAGWLHDGRGMLRGSTGIRPLLLLEEGQIIYMQRSRNRGTPIERMVEFIAEFQALKQVTIFHSGLGFDKSAFEEQFSLVLPELHWEEHIYGPVLAAHVGLGAFGTVVLEE
ncbi:MAG: DegV family protein [Anaerolineae bacterium]|nr:DegV family protein [Anaerolineae bacterium]